MKIWLPPLSCLPEHFRYPPDYLSMVASQIFPELDPWRVLGETPGELEDYVNAMQLSYPDRLLIPFARFEDSADGDLACFDGEDSSGNPKIYFHVYNYQKKMPAWEQRYHLESFAHWLQVAREEFQSYNSGGPA